MKAEEGRGVTPTAEQEANDRRKWGGQGADG
jgi:hypothetical protein